MIARARRFDAVALAIAPAALLVTAAGMRAARGPAWLAFNFDPTYAYLLNSLTILEGYPPFLIHHPGMPLQALGSVVMAVLYAISGHGGLARDVISRPETYVTTIHGAAAIVSAGMSAAAGLIVYRSAGAAAAILVQAGPWTAITAASLAGQMRAELLIAGSASLWAAFVVDHAARPQPSTPVRLGAMTGLTLALHMSSVPLTIGALLLVETWRDRRRLAFWTLAGFLVAFAPGWLKLPSFARHMSMIALHSGAFGTGPATIANVRTYLPALVALVAVEPVASAIVALSGAAWLAWRVDAAAGDAGPRRALGALTAMQLAALVVTAKHPDAHYLVPAHCTLGANMWLIARYVSRRSPAIRGPVAAAALLILAAVNGPRLAVETRLLRDLRGRQEQAAAAAADLIRQGCFSVTAYRASREEQALQWGNITAQYRGRPVLGPVIAERFSRAAFDEGQLSLRNADWQPVNAEAILRAEPCVVYQVETGHAPATTAAVTVEPVASTGIEGVYRLRPAPW